MAEEILSQKKCKPCEGNVKAFTDEEAEVLLLKVPMWALNMDRKHIVREFLLKNFSEGIAMMNKIKEVAEAENHHPDLHLENFRKLRVEISTHAVNGLTENDFILAAKIDELTKGIPTPANAALKTLQP